MRGLWFALTASLLTACATAGEEGAPITETLSESARLTELPPRTLEAGECGLFGWAREDGQFVFFSSDEAAQLVSDNRLSNLTPEGDFPATRYDPDVMLDLGTAEFLDGGQRYPEARLTVIQADGFELVQPLVLVLSCQE